MAEISTKNPIDLFVHGVRQGWNVAITSMLPNVIMAFVIIQILTVTKLLTFIGSIASPIMALWGLPGEAVIVLLAAFMSMGGAVGVAASLASAGSLSGSDVTILAPALMLMGAMIQYVGRCLGTADANRRYWGWHITICIINGLIAMWLMRFLIVFF